MILFDFLYSVVIVLSLPLWLKFLFKREYRYILKHRLIPDIKPGEGKRIWLHAVSVGEVKSVKSLIEQLLRKYNYEIVLSVTTPSGYDCARKEYKDLKVKVINAPLDFSFTVETFLRRINPAILILNELEIWPNWILKTKKAKIPILLINGRISDRAFKKYQIFKFFLKKFVNKIDLFLVQADIYREKFSMLDIPLKKIVVCGNIKADTAFDAANALPGDREILEYLRIRKNSKRIVTLASSHQDDEKIIIPVINKIRERYSVIIVPRHLRRSEEIGRLLKENGVPYSCWSVCEPVDIGKQVLIFDKMGYLFHIFKISDIVIMGGTFNKKTGGHNLYEPAVLGKLIVGGPYFNNFPDIGKDLEERGVYKKVTGPDQLLEFLRDIENIDFDRLKKEAVSSVTGKRGSVNCILKEIRAILP